MRLRNAGRSGWARIKHAVSLRGNLTTLWHRPPRNLPAVDGLRALSMFWVMATHVFLALSVYVDYPSFRSLVLRLPPYVSWIWHGEKALDTFFVISGFLIGGALLAEHRTTGSIDVRRFYLRRYLRLSPTYAVALLLVWATGLESATKTRFIWANLLYVNNFLTCDKMFMDWTWSLAVEEQFYMLLPVFLVAAFFRTRHKAGLLAALFAASFAVRGLFVALHPHIVSTSFAHHFFRNSPAFSCEYFESVYDNLYTRFGPFVVGLTLAHVHLHHGHRLRDLLTSRPLVVDGLLCAGLAIAASLLAAPIYHPDVVLSRLFLTVYAVGHRNAWAVAVALVLLSALYPLTPLSRAVSSVLSARCWYPVAQLSYSTYLFHLGFVVASYGLVARTRHPGIDPKQALTLFGLPELALAFAATILLSFAFGAIVYLVVERPVINIRR